MSEIFLLSSLDIKYLISSNNYLRIYFLIIHLIVCCCCCCLVFIGFVCEISCVQLLFSFFFLLFLYECFTYLYIELNLFFSYVFGASSLYSYIYCLGCLEKQNQEDIPIYTSIHTHMCMYIHICINIHIHIRNYCGLQGNGSWDYGGQ